MSQTFLSQNAQVAYAVGSYGAGTSTVQGYVTDMSGYDNVMYILNLGTVTSGGNVTLRVEGSDASNGSSNTTLANTGVNVDPVSNTTIVIDVIKPSNRYVFPLVVRATQNSVVNSITAIKYGARTVNITADGNTTSTTRTQVQ